MNESANKRRVAYKIKISDIFIGKPIIDANKFVFLELGNKKIVRVNTVGVIVERFESDGEKKYIFFTLDDGSGQIRLKIFSEDYEKFKNFYQGQTVVVIGLLRYWNEELYIAPEIIRELDPKYLLLRKLELEKDKIQENSTFMISREEKIAIKDKVLDIVKEAEKNEGIDLEDLISYLNSFPPEIINQEIKKLIEEGIIFEPRPGRIRWLG